LELWLRLGLHRAEGWMLMDKRHPSTPRKQVWHFAIYASWFCLTASAQPQVAINLSNAEALRIGKRVWQNECRGTEAGLTSWNEGETFASLGIGHFIWYPQGVRGPFEESFPKFLKFARDHAVELPSRLAQTQACPWNSRVEFLRARRSPEMNQLRTFLAHTVDVQAQFMVARLQESLAKMLDETASRDRANVQQQFARVASTRQGCYALVDYVNFKGEGTVHSERYHDQGWGLLQVLEGMRGSSSGPGAAAEFSRSAAAVLKRRVQNSPPSRKESRWLPGWINRIHSYSQDS
jgi:hypothetical protein